MGINETLEQISKELKEIKGEEDKEKKKKFRLPFGKSVSKGQAKKNYVTIIKRNENGEAQWLKEKIEEQTVMVDNVPRLVTPDHIIHYKKCPIVIIPSWSVEPINWKENYDKSLVNGTNIKGYQILLNRMKLSGVEGGKKQMASWVAWIAGLGLLAIIGYALYTGGI
jgi:hypothetical protein